MVSLDRELLTFEVWPKKYDGRDNGLEFSLPGVISLPYVGEQT